MVWKAMMMGIAGLLWVSTVWGEIWDTCVCPPQYRWERTEISDLAFTNATLAEIADHVVTQLYTDREASRDRLERFVIRPAITNLKASVTTDRITLYKFVEQLSTQCDLQYWWEDDRIVLAPRSEKHTEPTVTRWYYVLPHLMPEVGPGGSDVLADMRAFGDDDHSQPVWCYSRFGHSLTPLPGGRFVGIDGEHEDCYDPDFCIYNDVVLHDGQGGFQIFDYPRDVFPPTDFHSATMVGDSIFVIGCLGYPDDRRVGETPVYRLDLPTLSFSRVVSTGDVPGWISKHTATHQPGSSRIEIRGGVVWQLDAEGVPAMAPNERCYVLDTDSLTWGGEPVLAGGVR